MVVKISRSFTPEEQEIIKEKLFEVGKTLFAEQGFKKTAINDITSKVGIASGSFYQFFESKEDLFMKIYFTENQTITQKIMAEINCDKSPREVIPEVFFKLNREVINNTIRGSHDHQEQFLNIIKKLNPEMKEKARRESYAFFLPLLEKWQNEGLIKNINPDLLLTFFDAVYYVEMHKEDLGEVHFPQLIEYLVSFILDGITTDKGDRRL